MIGRILSGIFWTLVASAALALALWLFLGPPGWKLPLLRLALAGTLAWLPAVLVYILIWAVPMLIAAALLAEASSSD